MRVNLDGDTLTVDLTEPPKTSRHCGACTLCCRLLPMPKLAKPANTRCQHQRHAKGCAIYAKRPAECRDWSCRWLAEPAETAMLRRPDHAHYVVDLLPDRIRAVDKASGKETVWACVQVWMDPLHPEARHDPNLLAYIAHMAEPPRRMLTMLRFGSAKAVIIGAPSLTPSGEFEEATDTTLLPRTGLWGVPQ